MTDLTYPLYLWSCSPQPSTPHALYFCLICAVSWDNQESQLGAFPVGPPFLTIIHCLALLGVARILYLGARTHRKTILTLQNQLVV